MKNIRIWTLITAEMLQSKKACQPQIEIFKSEWPSGVKITKRNLLRAAEIGLDINWFSDEFLSTTAWEAYQKAMAPAYETCKKAKATALNAYKKKASIPLEVCEKVEALAREVYEKAMATAWEVYEKAMATALYNVIKYK